MAESRPRSVRRQLLTLILSAVSVAWIVAAAVSFRDARHEVAEVLKENARRTMTKLIPNMLRCCTATAAV